MLGTILFVDEATGTAIIRADDGKRYRFPATDWPAGSPLAASVRVDFDADGDRALSPLPINDAVVEAVTAAPVVTDPAPPAPIINDPVPVEPATEAPSVPLGKPISIEKSATPVNVPSADPDPIPAPATPEPIAARTEEPEGPPRPVPIETDEVPDYVGLGETETKSGGMSAIFVVGGVVLLLALAGLAYMMWDNAESAGFAQAAEESGESVSLFAQEDLPVRNVAAMTNATVLGRIARGDRVTGVEVPGSADPNSRWLRIDGGNRFVPMTGLGPTAPPALPATPIAPPPILPPTLPDGPDYEGTYGAQGGDYRADQNGPVDAVPPVPNRPAPPVRPSPPPERPAPVRPRPQPERQIQPSRPQDTRPVGPQRPNGPQRQGDPRETQPVG